MLKTNLLRLTIQGVLIFVSVILLSNIAHANDDAVIKATFLSYSHIQFGDTTKAPWRIVQAKDWKAALASKVSITAGMSNAASVATLSIKQREALYKAWQKAPKEIWVIYFFQPDHLELQEVAGRFQIVLVPSLSDAEQARHDANEKAELAANKPLNPAIYKQAGFDAKLFTEDFSDWQQRFKQDIDTFEAKMRKDHDYGRKLFEDKNPDALKHSYAQSIDIGHKGLSLRETLISAYYAPPEHEGTEVTPSGYVITQLLLSDNA